MVAYEIRDLAKAPEGEEKIAWVARRMPILNRLREEYGEKKPLAGKKVAASIHLEAKTAYLALTLKALGAEVSITGSNPSLPRMRWRRPWSRRGSPSSPGMGRRRKSISGI